MSKYDQVTYSHLWTAELELAPLVIQEMEEKNKQTKKGILELERDFTEMEISLDVFNSWLSEMAEGRVSELKERSIEFTQSAQTGWLSG